ncbi:bifunctional diaminohydroxyphosphoribosylaminopyrimidine deaminase/5-amino-6-(5-phosphoribosylamino)uracil reductase RibD [Roseobacter sp. HKCCA0434]|uniref:bifunctional diaminohydroxyphosphoribosylaminopyrimidine deaminase/5-amino-6-(5-phosphoribosylamino)uracil reductase RibD n=1 Tax=Roseobacter sp. HKCCA0434 TaxID=3079297 RepID=UPI002905A8EE|nr:bifunctional diaminohydroxyphosphoribosylaminopyrimidine deaminase/5-amino-6-(5-phosphoribosylamino)uracil reductase RibD [Roseobacter sp. HKCCA0434]
MDDRNARGLIHALRLAERGLGRTWPNPAVGCVIMNEGRVVGRGWTQPGGRPHAETVALGQAGEAARGATAYVSLEPCAHHGRTPPCADALVDAGIARVVVPMEDPDPRVSGRGFEILRSGGVTVDLAPQFAARAVAVNQGFLKRQATGRPLVELKLAASLDGRIATAGGESRWITGPEARAEVHMMRARADALLIGCGTAAADDPALDVRLPGLADAAPVRVVADSRLRLPVVGRLAEPGAPLWLLHGPAAREVDMEAWQKVGAKTLSCEVDEAGRLDLGFALDVLGARGITRLMCEGGGQLAATLLRRGLVDRLVMFHAGLTLGATGLASLADLGISALKDAPRWTLVESRLVGADVMSIWQPAAPA